MGKAANAFAAFMQNKIRRCGEICNLKLTITCVREKELFFYWNITRLINIIINISSFAIFTLHVVIINNE